VIAVFNGAGNSQYQQEFPITLRNRVGTPFEDFQNLIKNIAHTGEFPQRSKLYSRYLLREKDFTEIEKSVAQYLHYKGIAAVE